MVVDIAEVRQKLVDKLRPSGWADKLKVFLTSEDFDHLLERLHNEVTDGNRFTPPLKTVFRAFELCSWEDLKVVILGQDPYATLGVADGLAFSCSNKQLPIDPQLQVMLEDIRQSVYWDIEEQNYQPDPDLSRWAEQGVLLLNTALTTRIGKPGSHQSVWSEFTRFVLTAISDQQDQGIFAFMGAKAQGLAELVGDEHYKFFATHPSSAHYNGGSWTSRNLFLNINQALRDKGQTEIIW